jgi:hypothetical protein
MHCAELSKLGSGLLARISLTGSDEDLSACLKQAMGDHVSDSAGSAGDNGLLTPH